MKVNLGKYKKNGDRKIEVRIDPWDTWNCDDTLSLIIHPLFKEFKKNKTSYAIIKKEDVPEYLHNTYEEDEVASVSKEAYNWVLDEIIWATDPDWEENNGLASPDYILEKYTENRKRQDKAMELFGKYFYTFWD